MVTLQPKERGKKGNAGVCCRNQGRSLPDVFPLLLIPVPAGGRALGREDLHFLEAIAGHGHTPACIRTRGHAWGHMSFYSCVPSSENSPGPCTVIPFPAW